MKIARQLWDGGIRTELPYKANPKLLNQLQYCEEHVVPWVVLVGESELEKGIVKVRNVETREETEVQIDKLVDELKARLA